MNNAQKCDKECGQTPRIPFIFVLMNNSLSEAAKILTDPDFFRAAVNFTAQRTGFAARLIEKDYFCSILLEYLASASKDLVFKGGTCLAKVYVGLLSAAALYGAVRQQPQESQVIMDRTQRLMRAGRSRMCLILSTNQCT